MKEIQTMKDEKNSKSSMVYKVREDEHHFHHLFFSFLIKNYCLYPTGTRNSTNFYGVPAWISTVSDNDWWPYFISLHCFEYHLFETR